MAINYFKRWRVVFQSLHNLNAFSLSWNNWGYRFLELLSCVTVILLGILCSGFISQFIFLYTCPENKTLSRAFLHIVSSIQQWWFSHDDLLTETSQPRSHFVIWESNWGCRKIKENTKQNKKSRKIITSWIITRMKLKSIIVLVKRNWPQGKR